MRVGLCGAQGTGKSTLAEAVSREVGIPFIRTDVAAIIREAGYVTCRQDMPLSERLALQEVILNGIINALPAGDFITDRTPMDVMMYTLSWLPPFPTGIDAPEIAKQVRHLLDRCAEETDKHFSLVVQLHPGILLPDEAFLRGDRAPLDFPCVAREDALLTGLMYHHFRHMLRCRLAFMPAPVVDLGKRVDVVRSMNASVEQAMLDAL